jgi:hypothetical protein
MCQITPQKIDLHHVLTYSTVQQLSNNTTKQRQQLSLTPLHVQHKKKIMSRDATTERHQF